MAAFPRCTDGTRRPGMQARRSVISLAARARCLRQSNPENNIVSAGQDRGGAARECHAVAKGLQSSAANAEARKGKVRALAARWGPRRQICTRSSTRSYCPSSADRPAVDKRRASHPLPQAPSNLLHSSGSPALGRPSRKGASWARHVGSSLLAFQRARARERVKVGLRARPALTAERA
jgi:hypothetical protein